MNLRTALDLLGRVTGIAEKRRAFTARDAKDAKENRGKTNYNGRMKRMSVRPR
jgi:hypothetical protein